MSCVPHAQTILSLRKLSAKVKVQAQYFPAASNFVEAACWADDEKKTDNMYTTWHYINFPAVIADPPVGPITAVNTEHNVLWALENLNRTISNPNTNALDLSRAIFFFIHFAGDVHQPLHATTLYSRKYEPPEGDEGGNFYKIRYGNISNLHSFWDSGAGLWQGDPQRPLSDSNWRYLDEYVFFCLRGCTFFACNFWFSWAWR